MSERRADAVKELHMFASYAWTEKDGDSRVLKLVNYLRDKHGLKVFLDKDHLGQGNVLAQITEGVTSATVFLAFLTKKYVKKVDGEVMVERGQKMDYCQFEFNLCTLHHGAVSSIPVVMDEDLMNERTWGSMIAGLLGRNIWVNYTSDSMLEAAANQIDEYLEAVQQTPNLQMVRKDRIGVLSQVDIVRVKWIPETKKREFVANTRGWIFERMEDWHAKPKWVPMFGILGPAGIGKSVIMARLCELGHWFEDGYVYNVVVRLMEERKKERKSWRKSIQNGLKRFSMHKHQYEFLVAAAHFFKHDDSQASVAKQAMLSICFQLAQNVPGFFEEVRDAVLKMDINAVDLPETFRRLVALPLHKLDQKIGGFPGRLLVLFDALDECKQNQRELLEILQKTWMEEVPNWVGVVLAARPEDRIPAAMKVSEPVIINMDDEANKEDMRVFLKAKMKPFMADSDEDLDGAVKIVLERSEGLFIYGRFLQDNLERTRGGGLTLRDVEKKVDIFPTKLDGFYGEYFKRLKESLASEKGMDIKKLLGPMCVSREPLTIRVLQELLGLEDEEDTEDLVDKAQQLLVKAGNEVRFVHKSMSDFLLDRARNREKELRIKKKEAHKLLSEFCVNHLKSSTFAARNCVFHLCASGQRGKLSKLLCDFQWLHTALVEQEVNPRKLVGDYNEHFLGKEGASKDAEEVVKALGKGLNGLDRDSRELGGQLHGRLRKEHSIFGTFPDDVGYAWVKPTHASLVPANHPLRKTLQGHSFGVNSVAVDGDVIVSGDGAETVKLWSKSSGELLQTFQGHTSDYVKSVAVDGDVIVIGYGDTSVKVWSKSSGELLQTLLGHSDGVNSVAVDGDVIVSGSDDRTVKVWSKSRGELLHTLQGHSDYVKSVAVDGDVIVSGDGTIFGGRGVVKVWSKSSGELLQTLQGHSQLVMSVAVDGDVIVSGSDDRTVKVWSKSSGELLQTLQGHSNLVTSVAVDGNVIVSGSWDTTVKVWSKSSGELLQTLQGHSDHVYCVAVDGYVIVSGSRDKTVKVWSSQVYQASREELVELVEKMKVES